MGKIMIFSRIGIIIIAIILTVIFRLRKPVYQPGNRFAGSGRADLNNEPYGRITIPLSDHENQAS